MFVETKRDGETRIKSPSLEGFALWLETRDPSEEYNWCDTRGGCPIGRYLASVGVAWPPRANEYLQLALPGGVGSYSMVLRRPWTYGAALARVRAYLARN